MTKVQKHPLELQPGDVIINHPDAGDRWTVADPPVRYNDCAEVDVRGEVDGEPVKTTLVVAQHDTVTVETSPRQDYITGLRALADLLAEHPEVPTPLTGDIRHYPHGYGQMHVSGPGGAGETLAALLGRPTHVELRADRAWLTWHLAGLAVLATVPMEKAAERVVTGSVRVGSEVREVVEWVLSDRYQPATETTEETAR
jgi:hypothetical protein